MEFVSFAIVVSFVYGLSLEMELGSQEDSPCA
jgi:hypothetical protein